MGKGGLLPDQADRSVASSLVGVVDEARRLRADLGFSPYRVFSVTEAWSGGAVGRGNVSVVREIEFTPPPDVDFRPMRRRYGGAGSVERGEILLRKISARYTEDEIFSLMFRSLEPGEVGYIEIRSDGRNGDRQPKRRRFVVSGTPWLDPEGFEWIVRLRPQDNPRSRSGAPRRA